MNAVLQYRAASSRLRAMASENVHHTLRQRLLEMARQLEQTADLQVDGLGDRSSPDPLDA